MIKHYVQNTHAKTHSQYTMCIEKVLKYEHLVNILQKPLIFLFVSVDNRALCAEHSCQDPQPVLHES